MNKHQFSKAVADRLAFIGKSAELGALDGVGDQ
jgi:hypothetical protein